MDEAKKNLPHVGLDPSDDELSLRVGDPCPYLGCGGRLGEAIEDGTGEKQLVCPECGLSWGKEAPEIGSPPISEIGCFFCRSGFAIDECPICGRTK